MPFLRVPASCISSPSGTFFVGPTSAASLNVALTLRGALGSGEWKSRILNILASLHSLRMNVSGSSELFHLSSYQRVPEAQSQSSSRGQWFILYWIHGCKFRNPPFLDLPRGQAREFPLIRLNYQSFLSTSSRPAAWTLWHRISCRSRRISAKWWDGH